MEPTIGEYSIGAIALVLSAAACYLHSRHPRFQRLARWVYLSTAATLIVLIGLALRGWETPLVIAAESKTPFTERYQRTLTSPWLPRLQCTHNCKTDQQRTVYYRHQRTAMTIQNGKCTEYRTIVANAQGVSTTTGTMGDCPRGLHGGQR